MSKLEMLTKLAEVPWIKENPELLAILTKVIDLLRGVTPPPIIGGLPSPLISADALKVGSEYGSIAQRIWSKALFKMAQGISRRDAFLQALVELAPSAGDRLTALRLQQVSDLILAELSEIPSAAEMERVFTVADWRFLIQQKGVWLSAEACEAIVPNAGVLRGHHIVEKSIINELISRFGFTTLDEGQSPLKVLMNSEHFGPGGDSLHNKMFWVWQDGVVVGKTNLNPENLVNFRTASEMMDSLIVFYEDNGYSDLARATRGWCSKYGVPFTR